MQIYNAMKNETLSPTPHTSPCLSLSSFFRSDRSMRAVVSTTTLRLARLAYGSDASESASLTVIRPSRSNAASPICVRLIDNERLQCACAKLRLLDAANLVLFGHANASTWDVVDQEA